MSPCASRRPIRSSAAAVAMVLAGCLTVPPRSDRRDVGEASGDGPVGVETDPRDGGPGDLGTLEDVGPADAADAGPDDLGPRPDIGPGRDGGTPFPPTGLVVRDVVVADLDRDGRDDLVATDADAHRLYILYGRPTNFARVSDHQLATSMRAAAIHVADLVSSGTVAPDGRLDIFVGGEEANAPLIQGFEGPDFQVTYTKSLSGPDLGAFTGTLPVFLSSGRFRAAGPSLILGGEFRVALLELDGWSRTAFSDMREQYLPQGEIFSVSHNAVPRASTQGGLDDLLVVSETLVRWYPNPGQGEFTTQMSFVDFIHEQTRIVHFPDLPVQSMGVDGCTDFIGTRLASIFAFRLDCSQPRQPEGPFNAEFGLQDELVDLQVVDLDLSGRPEIVTLRLDGNQTRLAVFRDIVLQPPAAIERVRPDISLAVLGSPRYVRVGDFDGDGSREIVLLDDREEAPQCYSLETATTLVPCGAW